MSWNLILHGGTVVESVDWSDVGSDCQLGICDPGIANTFKFRQGIGKAICQSFAEGGLGFMQREQCLKILGLWCVEGVEVLGVIVTQLARKLLACSRFGSIVIRIFAAPCT